MAAHGLLLPVSSAGGYCCYEGYITAKGGLEYRLRLIMPSKSIKCARLECDWKLQNLLRGHEATVQKRLSESAGIKDFLMELKMLIQRLECSSQLTNVGVSTAGDVLPYSCYAKLMADLDQLGWPRVVHVSSDLSSIKLSVCDSRRRQHILSLSIPSQYPSRPPGVHADAPLAFTPHWSYPGPGANLVSVVDQFERWLQQFELLWDVLDEVDAECWVLEPENPTRACTFRRVVIGENLSLHMSLEPLSPRTPPQLTCLGADHETIPLMSKWNASLSQWNSKISVLENLKEILSISFPPAPSSTTVEEGGECAICYAYRLDGHVPSVVCDNHHCAQAFHNQCLYDWLRSLQAVTKYFNKITGACPFCGQLISSTAPT